MTSFLFWAMLMGLLWSSTYIPDAWTNEALATVMRIVGIVLSLLFFCISNLFEEKLKERIRKLEEKINKEEANK